MCMYVYPHAFVLYYHECSCVSVCMWTRAIMKHLARFGGLLLILVILGVLLRFLQRYLLLFTPILKTGLCVCVYVCVRVRVRVHVCV